MKQICLIMLMGFCANCLSLEMYASCWSRHTDREANNNEVNNCFGVKQGDWFAMTYYNSNYNQSYWIGKSNNKKLGLGFSSGLTYGLLSGYGGNTLPMFLPKLSWDYGRFGLDIHYFHDVVTTLDLRFKLGDYKNTRKDAFLAKSDWLASYSYGTLGRQYGLSYRITGDMSVTLQAGSGDHKSDKRLSDGLLEQLDKVGTNTSSMYLTWYPNNWHIGLFGGIAYNDISYQRYYRWSADVGDSYSLPITKDGYTIGYFRKSDFQYAKATAEWDKWNYMAGIRIGNPWRTDNPFQLYLELGAIQLNGLKLGAEYSATGLDKYQGSREVFDHYLQDFVQKEGKEALKQYKYLPIVQIGASLRF